jgi:glycosyltransferase involved in cell wall biosynthesis
LIFNNSRHTKFSHEYSKNILGLSCEDIQFVPESTLQYKKITGSKFKKIIFPDKLSISAPLYSNEMESILYNESISKKYDIVFFSGFSMFIYMNKFLINSVPVLVDVVDSPSILLKSYFLKEIKPLKKVKAFFNYIWAIRYESLHLSKAPNMILISDVDARVVKQHCPHSRIWSISNGVASNFFKHDPDIQPLPKSLLFTGVLSYQPNNEAMIYFINHIFPLIKSRITDCKLLIAGPDPSPELKSLAENDPQIDLKGYVEDIRTVFNRAEIYVSPLLSGAGMKNKILEAWAMAIPIVATSTSCSGINVTDGEDILIADDPVKFSNAVCHLFRNSELRTHLSQKGRNKVEKDFSWKSKSKLLEQCIYDVIKNFHSK